jgi:hypothetical protein
VSVVFEVFWGLVPHQLEGVPAFDQRLPFGGKPPNASIVKVGASTMT